jgi:DNA-binding CsgD family transcriptional regulator/plasmid stabilization system protein ParE
MGEMYGDTGMQHAEEIAVHYARADAPEQAPRAVRYLTAAGRNALERGAGREAAESLGAALAIVERGTDSLHLEEILALLGRARHRLGDYQAATALWTRAVHLAEGRGAHDRVATLERRMGVASLRRGDFSGALAHQERGRVAAALAHDEAAEASLRLARSSVMMELGKGDDAQREAELALEIAGRLADPHLLGRVHEALQSLAVWRGPESGVKTHGASALEYARRAGDARTAWQAEWTFALYAGLTGDSNGTATHLAEATRLAEEIRSPLLRLWTAEVAVEYRSGIGEWDEALALADRTLEEARAFGQRMLLPRLLVWSSLIHCGRGNFEEAKRRIDEAWVLSGADRLQDHEAVNVHTVVPAHVGLAYYHLYRRDYRAALEIGERGLALADRTGYEVWAVHRLLPLVAEASLWVRDWDRSNAYGQRMREAADRMGNSLARAWSDACVALERMLQGDQAGALTQLRQAADDLDAIPFVEHAARLRRKFADALLVAGRRDEAIVELRRIHDVFSRLRATLSLDDVREKLTELGVRPPPRVSSTGAGIGALTMRESEIARLVAARKSNKEVGAILGISARTVGTHLSSVYAKLGVDSRGALTDIIRELGV